MASLNPGKAMAQAAHAANQFVACVINEKNPEIMEKYEKWVSEGFGFGTTIVLDVINEKNIYDIFGEFVSMTDTSVYYDCGMVYDPSYPITDGDVIHQIPDVLTCMYAFCPKGAFETLNMLPLYR